jgi:tetratricopeptide (TPR) repeat protein
MTELFLKALRVAGFFAALSFSAAMQIHAQAAKDLPSAVQGEVQDAQSHPLAGVSISLEGMDPTHALTSKTSSDAQGQFHFTNVPLGSYTIHAQLAGYEDCTDGPFSLPIPKEKPIVLVLTKAAQTPASANNSAAAIPFSDEPAFTVAGVTDTTALGGHGSGPVVRNSNVLSKETASLAKKGSDSHNAPSNSAVHAGPEDEAAIRAKLAKEDTADLHAQLADIEETQGHPLDAVREYQRAAEMQPTEPHLFAWGAELLLHHAPEPAIEVFSKGHRLFPQSSRMMLGLGAAWYSQRSRDQAGRMFLEACDLHPADPTPYVFLGRLLVTEQATPPGWVDRMKRFAALHPEDAMAHYLYAVSLIKQDAPPDNHGLAESQLNAAIKLNPHLGDAYLQLGIHKAAREDFPGAIAALQKAVGNTSVPDDAHFRLAQVYRRMGDTENARREIELYEQLSQRKEEQAERERHEIPQFVYTLRGQSSAAPLAAPDSH